jgi:hypothetical protein
VAKSCGLVVDVNCLHSCGVEKHRALRVLKRLHACQEVAVFAGVCVLRGPVGVIYKLCQRDGCVYRHSWLISMFPVPKTVICLLLWGEGQSSLPLLMLQRRLIATFRGRL